MSMTSMKIESHGISFRIYGPALINPNQLDPRIKDQKGKSLHSYDHLWKP